MGNRHSKAEQGQNRQVDQVLEKWKFEDLFVHRCASFA